MENSADEVDDQGSGWLEVKKKHRSSSKFSLQSWVGGLSGRNASSRGQPSLNEKDVRSLGKCESRLQKVGKSSALHTQDNVGNSASTSKEDKKGVCYPYKSEVKEDSENLKSPSFIGSSNDTTGGTEDISHIDKPHALQKIKWGDLEDDALVQYPEKIVGVGAGINFGHIGDDSMLTCKKQENDSDLVSCLPSYKNPQENKLVPTSIDADSVPVQTPLLTCKHDVEESQNEVTEASSKDIEVPVKNVTLGNPDDDVSNCKEIYTEHVKRINSDELSSGCLSSEKVVVDVVIQESLRLGTGDLTDGRNKSKDSNSEVIAQDEICLPENSGILNSGESIIAASVENHGSDNSSKAQIMSVLGESGTAESKERFRERLWCFLFENLNRAVDELYLLCELECDLEQMKESILVLEEAASDFKELKNRVEEFDNVKKSTQLVDGVPITLKSDHRRPHALSWEVRRMTTSPHRAEILSSSLEAFKQIQQERAKNHPTSDAKNMRLGCHNQHNVSSVHLDKSAQVSDSATNPKDTVMKSKSLNGGSDISPANLAGEKRNVETGKSSKARSVQNGRVLSQNSLSSDANLSRASLKDGVAASAAAKSKREQVGVEAVKMSSKRDKTTESIAEKPPRDILRKQIPPNEKDNEKERRNVNTWKSMDAWKEKRNWEDILSSPFRVSSRVSHSPGMSRKSAERARILHDKLMSPEKKKKTAFDMKREAEEKHARAMRIRSELENERVQKLQRTSEKLNRVNEWQAVRSMKLREGMYARHQRSESRHEAFLAQVARRAGDESSKVNEVRFITSLNEENKKLMLRQKLHDSELRRAEKLQVIKAKQKEDMAREEAVLERKKLIEAEKLQRLAETQRKKEEAQVRREEERRASSAAREARAIEQLRRKEERVRAQQEEAELLAQKLIERLNESEQRRKFYLEQIRERASTDFRDQSSPLVRRSMNKEGQSRNTPTNNGEDYHTNSVSGIGDSTLANGTLQHSLKRRIKRIRQRLMALKFEFSEPSVGTENATIGYRTAVGTARAKIGRWLQELQRHRQARKEGAASIGLITAEMIKFLDGKEPELQASRQAGLLDFIASALPASHTSKPGACQVTIHLLKLLRVVLSAPANRSYFLAQNLLSPIIPMLSAALENYIKIAASVNMPGNNNSLPSKTSVENFESVSEVLDGFLWTVTTIIGHISSDERQLQMWDGLLELLIAYRVIHRLHDLFALYDRPQVEGSPFPSSILLSINLLVALTFRPGYKCSVDWESFPVETVVGKESEEVVVADSFDTRHISVNNHREDCVPPSSALNDSTIISLPDVPEDRPLDESCNKTNKFCNSVSTIEDVEPTCSSLGFIYCNGDVPVESQTILEDIPKSLAHQKDEKCLVDLDADHKNENKSNLKQSVAYLLSAISETGLVSLPSLLTAVLLQANNRMSSEQGSNVLPSNFDEVATAVLKVLNNLALLDVKFMQRILARPDLRMEFFHLMSFLLSYCTNEWKVATDKVGLLLLESLFLLGHFSLFHPGNQAVLRWGKSPTILHKVCDLPFVFFSDPELMPVLAGTLVAACYGCEQNKDVVQQELSLDMLLSLLRSCRNVMPAVGSNPNLDNVMMESSSECNQPGLELKKAQVESLRSSRLSAKSSRLSLTKVNNTKVGKIRNQRDGRSTKPCEDLALKHNLPTSETRASMLHHRCPRSFIEKAEQFFTGGSTSVSGDP